jgi:FkbM family methyltransferase
MIKSTAVAVLQKLAPNYYHRLSDQRFWKRRFHAMSQQYHEQELHIVPFLCDKHKTSIDIGAADGIYTIHIVDASRDCLAFEPRQPVSLELKEMAECLSLPIRVETVALSDTQGEVSLRILENDEGRSTIERENTLEDPDGSESREITVPVRRLDDYNLDSVGFVKIDVEGHELSVLRGGLATLQRCLPVILIEIEERHKPNAIRDVSEFLGDLGYEGYFVLNKHLIPVSCFDLPRHQNIEHIGGWRTNWKRFGVYVNNFFFVPRGERPRLEAAVYRVRRKLPTARGDPCAS